MRTMRAAGYRENSAVMPLGNRWRRGNTLVVKLIVPGAGLRMGRTLPTISRIIPVTRPVGGMEEVFFRVKISRVKTEKTT
ncbi:MAG: hypothetical protein JWQ04_1269 [Pedosphaera sp.]|nr:hypothetical protein [Pedosphaera sp.]